MKTALSSLFTPYRLGNLELANRVVMAPMTRSRAIGNVPNDLMVAYYGERASAGLIITEGTAPVADGVGYPRIPGIFTPAQIEGWRRVADAVHARQGKIFMQLMHTGRISHINNLPAGGQVVAPSAVRADEPMYTDSAGPQPLPEPLALDLEGVHKAAKGYAGAGKNAVAAGFDGVELHGANGYLIEQFLNPHTNRRTDAYGGSIEGRIRFALEAVGATSEAISPGRVGIRVSPYSTFNDMRTFDETEAQYVALAKGLAALKIAYVHIVLTADPRAATTARAIRAAFGGTVIVSSGFSGEKANDAIAQGEADLVAFGRPFLANPDLVERLKTGAALNEPDYTKLYTPGPEGYLGYPKMPA
jgi:N-ethylmaleimide reductase